MDTLANAVAWLEDFRHRKMVTACKYVQAGVVYEGVHLTLGLEDAVSDDDTGVIFNTQRQDFLASESEFREKGISPPMRGDIIVRNTSQHEIEYEVLGYGSEPPARYMTRYRNAWRIHAQFVRAEIPGGDASVAG